MGGVANYLENQQTVVDLFYYIGKALLPFPLGTLKLQQVSKLMYVQKRLIFAIIIKLLLARLTRKKLSYNFVVKISESSTKIKKNFNIHWQSNFSQNATDFPITFNVLHSALTFTTVCVSFLFLIVQFTRSQHLHINRNEFYMKFLRIL